MGFFSKGIVNPATCLFSLKASLIQLLAHFSLKYRRSSCLRILFWSVVDPAAGDLEKKFAAQENSLLAPTFYRQLR